MPRKYRAAKERTAALPAPAWVYELLVGDAPGVRLHGWPLLYVTGEPTADEVWQHHEDALLEEAAAAGFEAFWVRRRTPTGPAFEAWRARFVATHRY